jgi:hypothetical protein
MLNNRRSKTGLALVAAAAISQPAVAASSDSQLWTNGVLNLKLSDDWRLQEEMTGRWSDKRSGLYEIESNTLLGYRLNKTVTVWAGYTHDPQYLAGHFTVMEHRFVQHLVSSDLGKIAGGQLSGRIRLEQRWREGINGTGWRLRPYLRYSLPVASKPKLALTISEEPYFDLNTTSFQKVRGFERLRSFVGLTAPLTKNLSADLGYLNQHGFVRGGKDTNDNVAFVSVGLKL